MNSKLNPLLILIVLYLLIGGELSSLAAPESEIQVNPNLRYKEDVLTRSKAVILKTNSAIAKKKLSSSEKAKMHIERSIALENLGRFHQAIVEVTKAIRIQPRTIYYYCRRGDLFGAIERYNESYRDYRQALNVVPKTGSEFYYRALAQSRMNQFNKALKSCKRSLDRGYRNHKVFRLIGKCNYKMDRFSRAISYFNKAVRLKPTATSYLYLAKCYRKVNDLENAMHSVKKAAEKNPGSHLVVIERAILNYRLKKFTAARRDYRIWKQLVPESVKLYPDWSSFQVYCETEKKIDYYSKMIELSKSENAAPIYERAVLNIGLGQYQTGADELSQYLKLTEWSGRSGVLAASYCLICYQLSGQSFKADSIRAEARHQLTRHGWPVPIFEFLTAKISERSLIEKAKSKQEKTQARYFIALSKIQKNRPEEALNALAWVKSKGDPDVDEYGLSMAEIDRIKRRKALQISN